MKLRFRTFTCALAVVSAAACSAADDQASAPTPPETATPAGLSFNGLSFNGLSFNGLSFNGLSFNGLSFNGLSFNGATLNGLSFNGSELVGIDAGGVPRAGAELVGAELQGVFSNGSAVPIRVDGARAEGDTWFYRLSYPAEGGGRASPCPDAPGAPGEAVALAGRWDTRQGAPGGGAWVDDPETFTFACRGATLAKCVELGYRPWAAKNGTPLRDYHQACVRMLRADYCGDGRPGTLDGVQINLYDNLGIQSDAASGPTWVFEGQWGASGAACVDEYRVLELVAGGPVPECVLAKLSGQCAAGGYSGGALLRNEYNSAGVVGIVRSAVKGNPHTPLADKAEDALEKLEVAFAEFAKSPPDSLAALGALEGAVGDLAAATDAGALPDDYGDGLTNRLAGVARAQATAAIDANACQPKEASELAAAKSLRSQGDQARAAKKHKEAVGLYKASVDKAEDALGAPCAGP